MEEKLKVDSSEPRVREYVPEDDKKKTSKQNFKAESKSNEETTAEDVKEEVLNSKGVIRDFIDYIKSGRLLEKCSTVGKENGIAPKVLAKNFLSRALGTIGDVLGVAIDFGENIFTKAIQVLEMVLTGTITIVCNVARAIVRLLTLNKTAKA